MIKFSSKLELEMAKRAIDLSIEELAAIGAKAAHAAAQNSQRAGMDVTGTVTTYERKHATSSLAQLHPSGNVTLVREAVEPLAEETPIDAMPDVDKAAD
jgi:uncharacterized membrane protein YgdD (TMEM256/DUF423 family)